VEPTTLVEGIYSLPPGYRITLSVAGHHSRVRPEPYWDFAASAFPSVNTKKQERRSATVLLRSLLEESVESHLVADVPVGIFLSSGIDSTTLVALASRKKATLDTVTVVFPEQEFSEAEMARRTAQRFGAHHQELVLTGSDMLARLSEAVGALDQPSMDGINTYFASWAARQADLKVALSGLGGDEIFGGYSTFHSTPSAQSVASVAQNFPGAFRSALASVAEGILGCFDKDAYRKMAALWRDPDFLPHPYFYTRLLFTPEQVVGFLRKRALDSPEPWKDWLEQTARGSRQLDNFTAVSCLESRSYMVDTLLRDTDAMSMAHSLEVRVPFLNHPLVEFVARLPGAMKQSNGQAKSLLIEAVADLLPPEVVAQPKRTFTLPWEHWLRKTLREEVATELHDLASPLKECLDAQSAKQVWTDFLEGKTSWSRVWSLFVLNRWARLHLAI
jgi:asparagine synthase (glutamine-hydrolysing)